MDLPAARRPDAHPPYRVVLQQIVPLTRAEVEAALDADTGDDDRPWLRHVPTGRLAEQVLSSWPVYSADEAWTLLTAQRAAHRGSVPARQRIKILHVGDRPDHRSDPADGGCLEATVPTPAIGQATVPPTGGYRPSHRAPTRVRDVIRDVALVAAAPVTGLVVSMLLWAVAR